MGGSGCRRWCERVTEAVELLGGCRLPCGFSGWRGGGSRCRSGFIHGRKSTLPKNAKTDMTDDTTSNTPNTMAAITAVTHLRHVGIAPETPPTVATATTPAKCRAELLRSVDRSAT